MHDRVVFFSMGPQLSRASDAKNRSKKFFAFVADVF